MTTITKLHYQPSGQFGGAANYGNVSSYRYKLETNATGAPVDADSTAAIAVGDVIRLGILPAGLSLDDAQAVVSAAFTAATTAKLGFAYVDGVDDADVPQDDDYFGAALALSATARLRAATAVAPAVLAKDAYLILTWAGAANAQAGRLDVLVTGERLGDK